MAYIVSGGAINSTHSLTIATDVTVYAKIFFLPVCVCESVAEVNCLSVVVSTSSVDVWSLTVVVSSTVVVVVSTLSVVAKTKLRIYSVAQK